MYKSIWITSRGSMKIPIISNQLNLKLLILTRSDLNHERNVWAYAQILLNNSYTVKLITKLDKIFELLILKLVIILLMK